VCDDGGPDTSEKVRQTRTNARFMSFSSHAIKLDQ